MNHKVSSQIYIVDHSQNFIENTSFPFILTYHQSPMTTKIVHFLRPAVAIEPDTAFDPPLSHKGAQAADNMIKTLSSPMRAPTLVLTPPHKRYMETALRAFHPHFNPTLRNIASENAVENTDCNEVMQHFANGNVNFVLDPRLEDVMSESEVHERLIGMPSRLDMNPEYRKYFIFPEEFYPKYTEEQNYDPDVIQDWYKQKGMWRKGWRSIQSLERAASFKEFLYHRPDTEIIVITGHSFFDTLTNPQDKYCHHESLTYIWKPTISGRMRLISLTSPESQKDILEDEDLSEYWPYRLCGRSELFNKWYKKPLRKVLGILLGFEERKKYLGVDGLTLESLEAELGPEIVERVQNRVQGGKYYEF